MQIEIKPLDTVFFRDGKPFSMGEETWANGIFPPNPSVFAGVLRTIYMVENNIPSDEVLDKTIDLDIKGALVKKRRMLFPFPADMVLEKERQEDKDRPKMLQLKPRPSLSNYQIDLPYVLTLDTCHKVKEGNGFLTPERMREYLNAQEVFDFLPMEEVALTESKIGIARDRRTHIVNESMLYRVNMLRLEDSLRVGDFHRPEKDLTFIVHYENLPSIPKRGLCSIGAEGKKASYEVSDEDSIMTLIPLPELKNKYLKIYFITPAIFTSGWKPMWMETGEYMTKSGKKISVRLIACALGKKVSVGGFDMKGRVPKPMYQAVPSGSAYYLETDSIEDAKTLAQELHLSRISDVMPEYGYGWAVVGVVSNFKF